MTLPLTTWRQQLRGYLEMEQLFGSTEITLEKHQKTALLTEKEQFFSLFKLLVFVPSVIMPDNEQTLLNKMLGTLEIPLNEIKITDLSHESAEDQVRKYRPTAILSMGKTAKAFGFGDFSDDFSLNFNNISTFATYDARHLMNHNLDKKHSWQVLILLKNQLKP